VAKKMTWTHASMTTTRFLMLVDNTRTALWSPPLDNTIMPLFTYLIRIPILAILWQHQLTGCVPLDALDPEPLDPITTPADNMSPHLIKYNMDPEHLQRYFAFLNQSCCSYHGSYYYSTCSDLSAQCHALFLQISIPCIECCQTQQFGSPHGCCLLPLIPQPLMMAPLPPQSTVGVLPMWSSTFLE
jgi:hypothetical protein